MPEAVASNSIPASARQPCLKVDFDAFSDTIREGEALTMMLGALLHQHGSLHEDITMGIIGLFNKVMDDFRGVYQEAKSSRNEQATPVAYHRAVDLLTGGDGPALPTFHYVETQVLPKLGRVMGSNIGFTTHAAVLAALGSFSEDLGCTVQALMRLIIVQWLISEGWQPPLEASSQETGK